jgi:hypothetical protein
MPIKAAKTIIVTIPPSLNSLFIQAVRTGTVAALQKGEYFMAKWAFGKSFIDGGRWPPLMSIILGRRKCADGPLNCQISRPFPQFVIRFLQAGREGRQGCFDPHQLHS